MNILGINGFGQNPSACILQDGKLIAFAEEERFNRIKACRGVFPGLSVAYCLSFAKLTLDSIDGIAFGWDSTKYPWTMMRKFGVNYLKYKNSERLSYHKQKDSSSIVTTIKELFEWHPSRIRSEIMAGLRAVGIQGNIPKIEFVSHHLAHAYSTYFCSNFNSAGILTIDGSGEDLCTQLAIGDGDKVRVIESFPIPHSLGWFYAAITQYLGFTPYRDEGKLMGLAALGEKRKSSNKWLEPLSRILQIGNGTYQVDPTYTKFGGHYYGSRYTDKMSKLITSVDSNAVPVAHGEIVEVNGHVQSKYLLNEYVDLAWATQELLERAAIMLARKLVHEYGRDKLCIAGGVGLNCKMNGEILRQSGCKAIFVQPASNDAGTALGAAMYVAKELGENIRNPLKNAYMGPGFSNDEIYSVLKNCGISFQKVDNPAEEAAKLLEEGKIIAWFQGRMEFGQRALGNRSILANPVLPGMKDKVNAEVKYRESWRPFCPSITNEAMQNYVENPNEASFMIVAYHIRAEMREKLSSVVHIDGTIRPQVVTKESNLLYHSLISNLGKQTGHSVVLNTSFNVRGEPIICTPLEAIRCFYSNGLDALLLGDFILRKKDKT
jgi:carbamoyltransferase